MRASPLWKLVFVILVLLPFLPAMSVYAVVALARIKGCEAGGEEICIGGPISTARTIVEAAQASPGGGVVLLIALTWLALCYLSVTLGWKRTASRLLIGLAVTIILVGLPYFAALPSLGNFIEPHCRPYGGGFGVCGLFDGSIGSAEHILLIQVWASFIGAFASLAFPIYATVIVVSRKLRSTRTSIKPDTG